MIFGEFYERKRKWSLETFGPAQTTTGVVAHMRSEVRELRAAIAQPGREVGDVAAIREELADICLLAIDLSWRAGGAASDFGEIVGERNSITASTAATYIDRHLDTIDPLSMPARAVAVVIWDIAFRALGCDGSAIETKFSALLTRTWPDWRTVPADQPIEHVREVDGIPVLPAKFFDESWPDRIERVATESLSVDGQIAHLRAEVDGLRLLDEVNRLEMERVRAALHAKKDETTSVAAARVWSELLAAEGRGRDVLSALGRPFIEDPVKAAQRIVARRDEERKRAASVIDAVRSLVSAPDGVDTVEAVRRLVDLSNDRGRRIAELEERHLSMYQRTLEVLGSSDAEGTLRAAKRVVAERDALRANDEANIRERNHVRKLVDADPSETLIQAVRRYVGRADEQEIATLVAERDRQSKRGDDFLDMLRNIRTALGVGEGWTAAALIERAGQLRDDSVAYRSLRGRLVDAAGAETDFSDSDLVDLIADRINGPIADAEDDLLDQVQRLEDDVTTLKAALHVATRAVQS